MKREWRYTSYNLYSQPEAGRFDYYQLEDGLIVGQAYTHSYTFSPPSDYVWGAKILVDGTEEKVLGHYTEIEFAKKAVEKYWKKEDFFCCRRN
jgi:hypothetical protein